MRVCYFGTYEKNYSRNKTMIEGLRLNGVDVLECHYDIWKNKESKVSLKIFSRIRIVFSYLMSCACLLVKFFSLKKIDIFIVGYPGFFDVFVLKFLTFFKPKKIIFDAYLSFFDSFVNDRKVVRADGFMAKILWLVDKRACALADMVFLDTDEHIKYFCQEFNLMPEKFIKIPIGGSGKVAILKNSDNQTNVIFFGKYIPLHGIETIIKAADVLRNEKEIIFNMYGDGQTKKLAVDQAKKLKLYCVKFHGFTPYEKLAEIISRADIGLGIFGLTEKAGRVIPNKVYEMMASKIPFISRESKAIREELIDMHHCLFVQPGNPKDLAEKILLLKSDKDLGRKLVSNSYDLYCDKFSKKAIGLKVKEEIRKIL